jgi:hypothetical protein
MQVQKPHNSASEPPGSTVAELAASRPKAAFRRDV